MRDKINDPKGACARTAECPIATRFSGYTAKLTGLSFLAGFEMSYAELISRLRALPVEGRVQLFDRSALFDACFGLGAAGLHADVQWDDSLLHEHPSSHAGADRRLH